MGNTVLELDDVSFSYEKDITVIENVSISVSEGEKIGIIGPNGCGKSTILKLVSGLLTGDGNITVCGTKVCKKNIYQVRKNIGLVFQDSDNQLFMPTVYEDIAFGPKNYGATSEEIEKTVTEVLDRLGITNIQYKHNYKLSGGQKRMVCIAAVLAMNPKVVLMDEPSIALDPGNRRKVINYIKSMKETCVIASHDLDMVLETCSRVYLVNDKRVCASGDAYELLSNRELLESCNMELPLCMQNVSAYNG